MRRLKIEHLTTYEYGTPVHLGPHKLLIRPREGHDLRIESSSVTITPGHRLRWHRDLRGNSVAIVHFTEPAASLHCASEFHVRHFDEHPLDFIVVPTAVDYPFAYDEGERGELVPYQTSCFPADAGRVAEWVTAFWRPGWPIQTFTLLDRMNRSIPKHFGYVRRDEPGVQGPGETMLRGCGSCRDLATFFLEACRSLGLASRFASGYVHATGANGNEPASTHAWAEVYLPGAGWKGFDSTSGEMTGANHIAAAVSPHPADVPPVSGTFFGPTGLGPKLYVGVRVTEF